MQHLELTCECAVHHIQGQRLQLEAGHDRLEAELQHHRDQQHRRNDPEQRLPERCASDGAELPGQQVCSAGQAEVIHQREHLSGQHACQLPVRLSVEQHRHGEVADSPYSTDPRRNQERSKFCGKIFHGARVAQPYHATSVKM